MLEAPPPNRLGRGRDAPAAGSSEAHDAGRITFNSHLVLDGIDEYTIGLTGFTRKRVDLEFWY